MKKLISILIYVSFSCCHALAGIQLDWEYTVGQNDFSPIDASQIDSLMPPQHGITAIKVGPTGHTAVVLERAPYYYWDEGSNTSIEFDREIRFAIFDPQGNRIWLSNDLHPQFDGTTEIRVQILSVMPDSATFASSDQTMISSPVKMFSFNSSASPQLSQLTVTDQRLAAKAASGPAMSYEFAIQNESFPRNSFFTVGVAPGSMEPMMPNGLGYIIRKYSLNTLSEIRPVVASESGINGTNFVIRWQSTLNIGYQVQESPNMENWTDVGQPVVGNGAIMSWSAAIGSGSNFYRIVQL